MAVCMSTVTLQKCLILDCYATEKAGAIFVDDIDSRLVVTGTVIRDCRAPRAGALEVQNGVVDIVESVFDNCRADSVPGSQIDADERGVAIVIKNQGNVKSSIFTIVPACSFSASASLIHWVASHQHPLNLRGLQVVEPLACDTPVVVNSSSQISNHALGTVSGGLLSGCVTFHDGLHDTTCAGQGPGGWSCRPVGGRQSGQGIAYCRQRKPHPRCQRRRQ